MHVIKNRKINRFEKKKKKNKVVWKIRIRGMEDAEKRNVSRFSSPLRSSRAKFSKLLQPLTSPHRSDVNI